MIRSSLFLILVMTVAITSHAALQTSVKVKRSENSLQHWILRGNASQIAELTRTERLSSRALFSRTEQALLRKRGRNGLADTHVLKLSGPAEAGYLRGVIRKKKLNVSLQPDFVVRTRRVKRLAVPPTGGDPLVHEQWALKNTGAQHREFVNDFSSKYIQGVVGEDVHLPAQSKQGEGIIVATLDTGVDLNHPDLKNQIAYKPGECKALADYKACVEKDGQSKCKTLAAVDTDGNGYPLDCHGWNLTGDENPETGVVGDAEMEDPAEIAHGSHVAGIIAAEGMNGIGVRGIAPKARILPVRVINSSVGSGEGTVAGEEDATSLISVVVRGMLYAVNSKANIINLSLGWDRMAESLVQVASPEGSAPAKQMSLMEEAVDFAQSSGVLVVGSAGNDSTDALVYPCQISGVLCVAAHAADGNIASFSNYGSGVDIAAPGHNILSSMPLDYTPEVFTDFPGFDFMDGTSMAAPHVAGAAAVLMSQGYSADETFARLVAGARRRPLVGSKLTLSGNLDVDGALKVSPRPLIVPSVKGVTYGIWNPKERSVHLKFRLKNLWSAAKGVSLLLKSANGSVLSSFYRIRQTSLPVGAWPKGEEKRFEFDLDVLDTRLSSDVNIDVEVKDATGTISRIRVPFILSTRISKAAEHPSAITVPVRSGTLLPDSTLYSITSRDGGSGSDFLAVTPGGKEWKIQLVREESKGYVFGPVRRIPAMRNGGLRTRERLDVNFDGKSDYVFAFARDGDRPKDAAGGSGRLPVYYEFFYVNDQGDDVFPSFTYKNETADMSLDHLQWMRRGDRLVQAWVKVGTTPVSEKKSFDPWNPSPDDFPTPRIYYHDPLAKDGVRSITTPKGTMVEAVFDQSLEQRTLGEFTAVVADSNQFMTRYFTLPVFREAAIGQLQEIKFEEYRNLRRLDPIRPMQLQGADAPVLGLTGANGVNDQLVTALTLNASEVKVLHQRVLPNDWTDVAYKVIGAFLSTAPGRSQGLATFTQANYQFLYQDATLATPVETSLRRYTFLSELMFARLFYPVVTESRGERLPALFIADEFGAYLGAELITPVRNREGNTVALTRPAYLRFLNLDGDCEWLNPRPVTTEAPSEAIYFCGDRFVRIPYRF